MTVCTESFETLLVVRQGKVLNITLNRPQRSNAMNRQMLSELQQLVTQLSTSAESDVVIIRGAGQHFCAGGDIRDMAEVGEQFDAGEQQAYVQFNRAFGVLLQQFNQLPQTVIAVLHGAVMGGGFGLACVSDIALCHRQARFALPETGLGIPPAQIAPFLLQRIGLTRVRQLALSGMPIDGEQAQHIGLVHQSCDTDSDLKAALEQTLDRVLSCAPNANRMTKALLLQAAPRVDDGLLDQAASWFSQAITGDEGKEGSRAFMQKRRPAWHQRKDTVAGEQGDV